MKQRPTPAGPLVNRSDKLQFVERLKFVAERLRLLGSPTNGKVCRTLYRRSRNEKSAVNILRASCRRSGGVVDDDGELRNKERSHIQQGHRADHLQRRSPLGAFDQGKSADSRHAALESRSKVRRVRKRSSPREE